VSAPRPDLDAIESWAKAGAAGWKAWARHACDHVPALIAYVRWLEEERVGRLGVAPSRLAPSEPGEGSGASRDKESGEA
jgi:hypothetical protein